jgi:hypothetical protein
MNDEPHIVSIGGSVILVLAGNSSSKQHFWGLSNDETMALRVQYE